MTRPPVGSTGTLAELQVEAGDVYQHFDGSRYEARWNDGQLYNFDLLSGCWGVSVFESEQEYALISRAKPDQPAHIITHEGRTFDIFDDVQPLFGMLPDPVQSTLLSWDGVIQRWDGDWLDRAVDERHTLGFSSHIAYRAKPAPTETRVQCYRGEYGKAKEHGTCIKNPDGSLDWASWRDAE